MNAPAPGTSNKLLIVGGVSAGVGLLIHLILPLTYGSLESERSYDDQPWEAKRFGFAVTRLLGTSITGGGLGLADFAVLLGAVSIALAVAIRGFEPRVPRPVVPQGYPQAPYQGQYPQPQPGQAPMGAPDQGYQQQPWSGPSS